MGEAPNLTPSHRSEMDETREFWQAQWSRVTLKIIRRWEIEIHCMASNTWHKIKWTRILAERRLLKAGG